MEVEEMEVQWTSGCSEPAAAATQRRHRPSGGNNPAARKWRCSEPAAAAAPTQRQQRPSGEEMEVQRTSSCSEPTTTATQRRQRPSSGNEPANHRRWRGRLQGERREKWSCLEKWRLRRGRRKRKKGTHFGTDCQSPEAKWKCIGPGSSPPEAKSLL